MGRLGPGAPGGGLGAREGGTAMFVDARMSVEIKSVISGLDTPPIRYFEMSLLIRADNEKKKKL